MKQQLANVGGCQFCDLGLLYNVFSLFEGLGRASHRHILHVVFSFIVELQGPLSDVLTGTNVAWNCKLGGLNNQNNKIVAIRPLAPGANHKLNM